MLCESERETSAESFEYADNGERGFSDHSFDGGGHPFSAGEVWHSESQKWVIELLIYMDPIRQYLKITDDIQRKYLNL